MNGLIVIFTAILMLGTWAWYDERKTKQHGLKKIKDFVDSKEGEVSLFLPSRRSERQKMFSSNIYPDTFVATNKDGTLSFCECKICDSAMWHGNHYDTCPCPRCQKKEA